MKRFTLSEVTLKGHRECTVFAKFLPIR